MFLRDDLLSASPFASPITLRLLFRHMQQAQHYKSSSSRDTQAIAGVRLRTGCGGFVQCSLIIITLVLGGVSATAQSRWQAPMPLEAANTPADEYAPAWCFPERRLVFTQERKKRARLMSMQNPSSTDATVPIQEITIPDLPPTAQVSYASWSAAGDMLYCAFRSTGKGRVINVMERSFVNSVWGPSRFVAECASDDFNGQVTISPDGSTMVFASDRDGGVGKLDLWMCKKSGSVWDSPVHMGELLNSAENEITPFLASSDTLYFAGDGFGGRGGYDVYRTVLVSGEWQSPVPMDVCNTPFDDSDFCVLPDGTAVFASTRPGGKGGLDLYWCKKK
jgi:hypothetical protein